MSADIRSVNDQCNGRASHEGPSPNQGRSPIVTRANGGAQPPPHIGRQSRDIDVRSIEKKMLLTVLGRDRKLIVPSTNLEPPVEHTYRDLQA
jgi:hypothetical protein